MRIIARSTPSSAQSLGWKDTVWGLPVRQNLRLFGYSNGELTSPAAPWRTISLLGLAASILATASSKRFPYAFSEGLLVPIRHTLVPCWKQILFHVQNVEKWNLGLAKEGILAKMFSKPCAAVAPGLRSPLTMSGQRNEMESACFLIENSIGWFCCFCVSGSDRSIEWRLRSSSCAIVALLTLVMETNCNRGRQGQLRRRLLKQIRHWKLWRDGKLRQKVANWNSNNLAKSIDLGFCSKEVFNLEPSLIQLAVSRSSMTGLGVGNEGNAEESPWEQLIIVSWSRFLRRMKHVSFADPWTTKLRA